MGTIRVFVQQLPFSNELRQGYRAFVKRGALRAYVFYRFLATFRLRRRQTPLDRPVTTTQYSMHLLCSHHDVNLLIWALASWYSATSQAPQVYVHEDGTFTTRDRQLLRTLFPLAQVIDWHWATKQAIQTWLVDFPQLLHYRHRLGQHFAVKFLDPYFIAPSERVLVVDTDVLWFREPDELFNAISTDKSPVFWQEKRFQHFTFSTGEPFPKELGYLNSGLVLYHKRDFDVQKAEQFARKIVLPDHLFVDQPAYAYALGHERQVIALPTETYRIKGRINSSTVAKHYTSPRREQFWFEGVKYIATQQTLWQEKSFQKSM